LGDAGSRSEQEIWGDGSATGEGAVAVAFHTTAGLARAKARRVPCDRSPRHRLLHRRARHRNPGDTVIYQITVTNTGQTTLVLALSDPRCDAGTLSGPVPALTGHILPVGASVQYTCSHVLAVGDAPTYTNTASVTGTAPDNSQVTDSDSVNANVHLTPPITLTKLERIGNTGSFTSGPVTGNPGETVTYLMTVTNTGQTPLKLAFSDPRCDTGTLSGPLPTLTANTPPVGAWVHYKCSHVLAGGDAPYTNTASVTGTAPDHTKVQASDSVDAFSPAQQAGVVMTKLVRIDGSGAFTGGPVNTSPGNTLNYQMTVSNTGQTPLVISFTDPKCDAGTMSEPRVLTGAYDNASQTLSAGGSIRYTCAHSVTALDTPAYDNTASVTGTTPGGTKVQDSDSVSANVNTEHPSLGTFKLQRLGTRGP
jgi:hypothetical protein